jgi:hypothetical protein
MRLRLDDFSERALNYLASMVYGQDARVLVSPRAREPLTVAFGSRTLALHPETAGFYDLFLGARLLGQRRKFEGFHRAGRQVSRGVQRRWVRQAVASLSADYPRVQCLSGFHHPGREGTVPPTLTWDRLTFEALDPSQLTGPGRIDGAPGVYHDGAQDDFNPSSGGPGRRDLSHGAPA